MRLIPGNNICLFFESLFYIILSFRLIPIRSSQVPSHYPPFISLPSSSIMHLSNLLIPNSRILESLLRIASTEKKLRIKAWRGCFLPVPDFFWGAGFKRSCLMECSISIPSPSPFPPSSQNALHTPTLTQPPESYIYIYNIATTNTQPKPRKPALVLS